MIFIPFFVIILLSDIVRQLPGIHSKPVPSIFYKTILEKCKNSGLHSLDLDQDPMLIPCSNWTVRHLTNADWNTEGFWCTTYLVAYTQNCRRIDSSKGQKYTLDQICRNISIVPNETEYNVRQFIGTEQKCRSLCINEMGGPKTICTLLFQLSNNNMDKKPSPDLKIDQKTTVKSTSTAHGSVLANQTSVTSDQRALNTSQIMKTPSTVIGQSVTSEKQKVEGEKMSNQQEAPGPPVPVPVTNENKPVNIVTDTGSNAIAKNPVKIEPIMSVASEKKPHNDNNVDNQNEGEDVGEIGVDDDDDVDNDGVFVNNNEEGVENANSKNDWQSIGKVKDFTKPHFMSEFANSRKDFETSDSYFFTYFMLMCIFVIGGYIAYHNKHKVFALLLEGRRGKRPTRTRKSNSATYHKLDSNLEEAISSSCNKTTQNVITRGARKIRMELIKTHCGNA